MKAYSLLLKAVTVTSLTYSAYCFTSSSLSSPSLFPSITSVHGKKSFFSLYSCAALSNYDEDNNYGDQTVVISPNSKRETCVACKRISRLCVCKVCKEKLYEVGLEDKKLRTDTFITILQDSHEHRRKLGSAVIAEQCLQNCNIIWRFCDGQNATLVPRIDARSDEHKLVVLYPSNDAIPLSQIQEQGGKLHLIVLDSTWYRAKKMYSRIPWIKDIPTVKLTENVIDRRPSGYKFRKQPDKYSFSTAECIGEAIREIEGNDVANNVIRSAFERSVQLQIEETQSRVARPHYHGRGQGRAESTEGRDHEVPPQASQSNHVKIRVSVPEKSIPALDWALGATRRISENHDLENKLYTVVFSAPRDEADDLIEIIKSGVHGEANRRGSLPGEIDVFSIEKVPGRTLGGGRRFYS